jgi:hypothetical protein
MRGSIAIWHDTFPIVADGYAPRVEVHVNIWRNSQRNKRDHFDLFDIGFRFRELRALRSLSISLPFVIDQKYVSDLFEVMDDPRTLSAIFNDTLTPKSKQEGGNCFEAAHPERSGVQFYVWRCPADMRQFGTIGECSDRGTVITISDQFFERLRAHVGDHYFRLLIKLPIGAEVNGFVSSNDPKDSAFLSTISTSEIVEFRLNEKRNFSTAIRDRLQADHCGLIDISAVHYFLIRDMGVEMTQAHTSFRKMRRLEPNMWGHYLQGCSGFDPDRMIIYHWASPASGTAAVESFTALATFRAYYTGSLWAYGLVIVALGAMGSATQSVGAAIFGAILKGSWPTWDSLGANLVLLTLFTGALALWVCWPRWAPWMQWSRWKTK